MYISSPPTMNLLRGLIIVLNPKKHIVCNFGLKLWEPSNVGKVVK